MSIAPEPLADFEQDQESRPHPLSGTGSIAAFYNEESQPLTPLRAQSAGFVFYSEISPDSEVKLHANASCKITPPHARGISLAGGQFHARKAFHKSRKGFISLKKALAFEPPQIFPRVKHLV